MGVLWNPGAGGLVDDELPGGAVNTHAANNAYARIDRAGPGLAGPRKSSPWISVRQYAQRDATRRAWCEALGSGSSTAATRSPQFEQCGPRTM